MSRAVVKAAIQRPAIFPSLCRERLCRGEFQMDYKFVATLLGAISIAGAALAADPVRTPPPTSAGPAPAKSAGNRDHIDQDAQTKTQPTAPTNGVGGTGGGRLSTGGLNTSTGTITNTGTMNDKR